MSRKWLFPVVLLGFCLAIMAVGFLVGRGYESRRRAENPLEFTEEIENAVEKTFASETVAGIFEVSGRSTDGLEACYYADDPDFEAITWVSPAMPTPFVNFAPAPGRYYSAYINKQQFRYDEEVVVPKPEDVYRIFLIGGSVAYGAAAPANKRTVGGYLEKLLNTAKRRERFGRRVEVITFANVGWCSTHERVAVHNRLLRFEPDMVIALTGHNDIAAALALGGLNILWGRLFAEEMFYVLSNYVLYSRFQRPLPPLNPGAEPVSDAQINERMEYNVRLTHHVLHERDIDYVVALQPVLSNSAKERTAREALAIELSEVASRMKPRYEAMRSTLAGITEPGLTFLDLSTMFDDAGPEELFIDNCHFGDRGNDLMARSMLSTVVGLMAERLGR